MYMACGVRRLAGAKSFVHKYLTITRDPLIIGATFYTLGPKRDCRFWRQPNGITILLDPVTNVPFGWFEMEGEAVEAVIQLPMMGTFAALHEDPH